MRLLDLFCGAGGSADVVPVAGEDSQRNIMYPKTVKPGEVVNENFAPGLFRIRGGRALYDEVYMADGGRAYYLGRVTTTSKGLSVTKRWINPDTELEQMFEMG